MGRKNRRASRPMRQLPPDGSSFVPTSTVDVHGVQYKVRPFGSARATKFYICPGCHQNIPPGGAHVVAWYADRDGDDRRHWHRHCWDIISS